MTEVMSFRLSKEHRNKLVQLAEAWGINQTEVVRKLLEEAKVDAVIRNKLDDKDGFDLKSASVDKSNLIKELKQLHMEARRREAAKRGEKL